VVALTNHPTDEVLRITVQDNRVTEEQGSRVTEEQGSKVTETQESRDQITLDAGEDSGDNETGQSKSSRLWVMPQVNVQ
jgi:hypothetical protein